MKHLLWIGVCACVALGALWGKAAWESGAAMAQAEEAERDRPVERAAYLTFSAQQIAPMGAANDGAVALEAMALEPVDGGLGRAGLTAASGGARSLVRPYEDALRRSGTQLPRDAAPSPWLALLGGGLFFLWLTLAFAWIVQGHDSAGCPTGRRWPWVTGIAFSMIAWAVTSWMA